MESLKKTFLTAIVFLGSFSSYFAHAKDLPSSHPLEGRLQHLDEEQEESERLHRLFDLYWDWQMAESPEDASYYGYPGNYDQWSDLSTEAIQRRQQFTTQLLDALISISTTPLAKEDKISAHILKRILEEKKASTQFGSHYLLIDQMQGIHLFAPLIIEMMPTKTVEDYENILSRLQRLPQFFKQTIHLLEQGVATGITPSRIAIRHVPQQILNQMTDRPLDSPFLIAFKIFPDSIDAEIQSQLLTKATTIYQQILAPSLNQFYTYLTESYIPHCRKTIACTDLPNGQAWYAHQVQSYTTTTLTPQEIHNIGLKEVKRIYEAMLDIIQETEFKGRFTDFLYFLQTDPQFFYTNRQDLLQGYQTLTRYIESKLSSLFAHLPILPFEVVPVPSYSEESQIGAYYYPGSIKDQRPGYFFINTSYPEQRPKWEMEPLALHEAVPGHHLQITLAQELQKIPEFRKNANFTSYIEGWGLYAESLGSELGLYRDPYSIFGRLSYEMLRAIRLVVDTGMHTMGWSRQQAIDFFKQYVGMSDHEITTEIDRYIVMPGQALAYKIGELKLQEMRKFATQILGEKFDIRAFHQAWLQRGTIPLDIAEQQIHEWVEYQMNK